VKEVGLNLQFWSLGDKLEARLFKNFVVERIHEKHLVFRFSVKEAECCWAKIPETSQLRKFFLDIFPRHWMYQSHYKGMEQEWGDFLMKHPDLARLTLLGLAGKDAKKHGEFGPTPLENYLE
jgi:hypothetical protein